MRPDYQDYMHYLTVTAAYSPKRIPGKTQLTFLTKITGLPQLWTLNERRQPVPYVETIDRVLYYAHSPLGDRTVIGMDHKGNEKQQIYLYHAGDTEAKPLAVSPDSFHYIGGWSPDGRSICFSSNRRHPGSFDLFTLHTDTGALQTIYNSDQFCVPVSWYDEDQILIRIDETNLNVAFYLLNVNTKEKRRIGTISARYQSVTFHPDYNVGYVLTDAGADNLRLCRFDVSHPEQLQTIYNWGKWDLEKITCSPDGKQIAFTVNEDGRSLLGLYDLSTAKSRLVTGMPEGIIDSLAWLDQEALILGLKSATIAGDIWRYDLSDRKATRLTSISQSSTIGSFLIEPELNHYQSFDHLSIPYFYYEQQPSAQKPAVIYVHGGPESQYKPDYHPMIQYLVKQGFAVAAPNVRGSNGYGRAYLELDDQRKRMDSVRDLAWLVKDLIKNHQVDPKRIGIIGRSYGGFMVMSAITEYPELWAAAVDVVGITHFTSMLSQTGEWRRAQRSCEYGHLESDQDFFEEVAPINHVAKIKSPLLIFHGLNDSRVPVSESINLEKEMKKYGKSVQLTLFEDEGHQTEKLNNHITMRGEAIRFFMEQLK
jgi:dipeptidyl aminopeptidase/acylaminoacyl peptidase